MIINTFLRNGTKSKPLQNIIYSECSNLNNKSHCINKIIVSLYKKQPYKKANGEIRCHISIEASNKHHIDVYENDSFTINAFISAFEKAETLLLSDLAKSDKLQLTNNLARYAP